MQPAEPPYGGAMLRQAHDLRNVIVLLATAFAAI
jgi:hypothetical protein